MTRAARGMLVAAASAVLSSPGHAQMGVNAMVGAIEKAAGAKCFAVYSWNVQVLGRPMCRAGRQELKHELLFRDERLRVVIGLGASIGSLWRTIRETDSRIGSVAGMRAELQRAAVAAGLPVYDALAIGQTINTLRVGGVTPRTLLTRSAIDALNRADRVVTAEEARQRDVYEANEARVRRAEQARGVAGTLATERALPGVLKALEDREGLLRSGQATGAEAERLAAEITVLTGYLQNLRTRSDAQRAVGAAAELLQRHREDRATGVVIRGRAPGGVP